MNAVVTYIFGENQEILREPLVVDPGVDYICVTDQPSLKSKHWRIIVDDIPQAKCIRDKMPLVKYNPFKYTNADRIIVMDGTLQVRNTLMPLFDTLMYNSLLIKRHPDRDTLSDELMAWVTLRGMNATVVNAFHAMAQLDHIDLDNKFLVESCIIGYRRNNMIAQLCLQVLYYMRFLGENGKLCMTNQCPLTYLIEKNNIKYSCIDQQLIATRYHHNTWVKVDR
jgi:hypothetical protein